MTTTAYGLTMDWQVYRPHRFNSANPFTIAGSVNGECRLQCAISARTAGDLQKLEQRVIARLREIAAEVEAVQI